jgi:hypothetical protein
VAYYVVVEGDGDQRSVPNLVSRWCQALGDHQSFWRPPIRINVQREQDAGRVVDLVAARRDAEGLLVLRDDEDGCPKVDGPAMAQWFKDLAAPFPIACVLLYREYETLFLPFLSEWAGRTLSNGRAGLLPDATFSGDPQGPRDAKGVLTKCMAPGRAYKETVDQLEYTRLLDIDALRASKLPCAETLDRGLRFLLGPSSGSEVFPLDR